MSLEIIRRYVPTPFPCWNLVSAPGMHSRTPRCSQRCGHGLTLLLPLPPWVLILVSAPPPICLLFGAMPFVPTSLVYMLFAHLHPPRCPGSALFPFFFSSYCAVVFAVVLSLIPPPPPRLSEFSPRRVSLCLFSFSSWLSPLFGCSLLLLFLHFLSLPLLHYLNSLPLICLHYLHLFVLPLE